MQGFDVIFSTGSDEHGQKIENCAKKAGVTPKKFVDDIVSNFKKLWDILNISYDKFIRTTVNKIIIPQIPKVPPAIMNKILRNDIGS